MLKLIEIFCAKLLSPSVRRAWIEIRSIPSIWAERTGSPSVRRAWIEMLWADTPVCDAEVTLREEGVD